MSRCLPAKCDDIGAKDTLRGRPLAGDDPGGWRVVPLPTQGGVRPGDGSAGCGGWFAVTTTPATTPAGGLRLGRIGEIVPRADGAAKTPGEFAYSSDLSAPGMLWGHTLRSPHAHARIRAIDISAAVSMPGVHAVLTHADVPGEKLYGLEFRDQPVLAIDRVRYFGEPVALVAAEHPEQARRAAEAIVVDWEPLEPVTDMERATDGPELHPDRPTQGARLSRRSEAERRPHDRRSPRRHRRSRWPRGRRRLRDGNPGPGIPRPRVGNGRSGRRGRRRHPCRDAVAPRRQGPDRPLPRACRPRACASTSRASAAHSAAVRTSRCRSTRHCSPCTRTAR